MIRLVFLFPASLFLLLAGGCFETSDPQGSDRVPASRPSGGDSFSSDVVPGSSRPGEYGLIKGDRVIVNLSGMPTPETVEDIVDANGMITMPLIDEVPVVGRSSREIEAAIKAKYVPNYYQTINVTVLVPSKSYYVEGKVMNPGKYPLKGVVSVLQAIAEAGGASEFAHKRTVVLTRGGKTYTLNREEIKGSPRLDVPLEPNDRIFVEKAAW